jgi:hypothetical protein
VLETSTIVALFVFLVGLGLCAWRFREADGLHAILCLIAAVLWSSMLIFEPATRRLSFAMATGFFFLFAVGQYFRRPERKRLRR